MCSLPDIVRFICETNGNDVEKIGQYFLEILPRFVRPKKDNNNASEPMWFRGVAASMGK